MNDRLKYRIWWESRQKYIDDRMLITPTGRKLWSGMTIPVLPSEDDDYIVEQCTGLSDKNGKLIYEGNIVAGRYFNPHHPKTPNPKIKGVVTFVQDRMTWIIEDGDCGYDLEDCMPTKDCFVIIGNIHEQAEQKDK